QKYLLTVLERSGQALDAIEEGLIDATNREPVPVDSAKALKLVDRIVKQTAKPASLSTTA
ncbi:MAG: hypothetical protein WAO17_05415, partial [Candidatus Sulfotelmatobacter sp.]